MTVQQQALQLPRAEKLKLLEALGADLSQPADIFESPEWHAAALRETEERLASGQEQVHGWPASKQQLREE